MKAVILAGGLGTRLRPLTINKPKPMLNVGEKPIIEHLINWTKKGGVKSIVLCVSYLRKSIQDYFEDGNKFGIKIEYAISKKPPDIIYHKGDFGKEPMIIVFAETPDILMKKIIKII